MNYKFLIIVILFLSACVTDNDYKIKSENDLINETFSNKGFALLFTEDLKKKKLLIKKLMIVN